MRLFWKLFLALLFSLLAIAAASSWLSQRWLLQNQQINQRLTRMASFAETAVGLYSEEGPAALRRWLHRTLPQMRFHGVLLDGNGNSLLPRRRPLPPDAEALVRKAIDSGQPQRLIRPPHLLSITPIATPHGQYYWLAASRIGPDAMQQSMQYAMLLRLSLALLLILLVSWMLSRMFTRPIRQLQQSAAQLGSGRMDTRAPQPLIARGDELGELAHSFNTMAAQLEGLLASHKQLLRDVSHELRSPLARLSVALELAKDTAGEAAQEDLSRIGIEAERLSELIGEVLTLARFEQAAIRADMTELDLAELLRETVADAAFEAEASGKSVALKELPACRIRGDRLWLGRALDNVLRNAVRHTLAGSAVEIDMHCDGEQAEISVRDHGPGVSDEALEHLFEPFFRAEEARSRTSGGYGLGLAIARSVIEMHAGRIRASHAPDSGLLIGITLPLR